MICLTCSKPLTGRQKKFCSLLCKNKNNNNLYQNYQKQQLRALERKLLLVAEAGGCCSLCGYSKNLAALCFHHLDPTKKDFQITSREISNHSLVKLKEEISKCQLLCCNCHMEVHYPNLYHLDPLVKSNALTN